MEQAEPNASTRWSVPVQARQSWVMLELTMRLAITLAPHRLRTCSRCRALIFTSCPYTLSAQVAPRGLITSIPAIWKAWSTTTPGGLHWQSLSFACRVWRFMNYAWWNFWCYDCDRAQPWRHFEPVAQHARHIATQSGRPDEYVVKARLDHQTSAFKRQRATGCMPRRPETRRYKKQRKQRMFCRIKSRYT